MYFDPCVFSVFLFLVIITPGFCVPRPELAALLDLYESTGGDRWNWRPELVAGPQWNFSDSSRDPCSYMMQVWQGIQCNYNASFCATNISACSIITISLNAYALNGTLPSSLMQLSKLEWYSTIPILQPLHARSYGSPSQ